MKSKEVTPIVVDKDMLGQLLTLAECEVETRISLGGDSKEEGTDKVLLYFQKLLV